MVERLGELTDWMLLSPRRGRQEVFPTTWTADRAQKTRLQNALGAALGQSVGEVETHGKTEQPEASIDPATQTVTVSKVQCGRICTRIDFSWRVRSAH